MEDIIEQLQELNQDVPVPLEPACFDDILTVEEQIFLPMPDDYKVFLEEVGDIIYGTIEPCTVSDPSSHTYLAEVTAYAWDIGMPRHLFAICQSPDGFYAMDEYGEISLWKDGVTAEETWSTIWMWARDVWLES